MNHTIQTRKPTKGTKKISYMKRPYSQILVREIHAQVDTMISTRVL